MPFSALPALMATPIVIIPTDAAEERVRLLNPRFDRRPTDGERRP